MDTQTLGHTHQSARRTVAVGGHVSVGCAVGTETGYFGWILPTPHHAAAPRHTIYLAIHYYNIFTTLNDATGWAIIVIAQLPDQALAFLSAQPPFSTSTPSSGTPNSQVAYALAAACCMATIPTTRRATAACIYITHANATAPQRCPLPQTRFTGRLNDWAVATASPLAVPLALHASSQASTTMPSPKGVISCAGHRTDTTHTLNDSATRPSVPVPSARHLSEGGGPPPDATPCSRAADMTCICRSRADHCSSFAGQVPLARLSLCWRAWFYSVSCSLACV